MEREDKTPPGQAKSLTVASPAVKMPPASPFATAASTAREAYDGARPAPPSPPPSSSTGAKPFSPLELRISLPLELAMSGKQRADGAREARTLLPGVDLSSNFWGLDDNEGSSAGFQSEGFQGGGGLAVLQTPKGLDLREVAFEAAAFASPNRLHSLCEASSLLPQHLSSTEPSGGSLEALVSKLNLRHVSSMLSASLSGEEATAAAFSTPPAVPAVPGLPLPTSAAAAAASGTPKPWPSLLRIDVDAPAASAALAPEASPLGPSLFSPGPSSWVSMEHKAAAAVHLWPSLAPFAPNMLRDDILRPSEQRHYIQTATHTSDAQPQPANASGWRLDTETKPRARCFRAAVAVADVSGFTALTEALSLTGSGGIELLTRCMNSYFAQVIDLVMLHGGDVCKFAGDAMLVVFEPTAAEAEGSEDGGLRRAMLRAAAAAKELVDRFGVMSMQPNGEALPLPREQVTLEGGQFVKVAAANLQHASSMEADALAYDASKDASTSRQRVKRGPRAPSMTPWRRKAAPSGGRPESSNDGGELRETRSYSAPTTPTKARGGAPTERTGEPPSPGRLNRFVSASQAAARLRRRTRTGPSSEAQVEPLRPSHSARTLSETGSGVGRDSLRMRSIHERTLAAFAAEFSLGGVRAVRPPELPHEQQPEAPTGPFATTLPGGPQLARGSASQRGLSFSSAASGGLRMPSASSTATSGAGQLSFSGFSGFPGFQNLVPEAATAEEGEAATPNTSKNIKANQGRGWTVRKLLNGAFTRGGSSTSAGSGGSVSEARRGSSATSLAAGGGGHGSFLAVRALPTFDSASAPCSPLNSPPTSPHRDDPDRDAPPAPLSSIARDGSGNLNQDLLSLKVTVAAGDLCAYRVGGVMEPTADGSLDAARWEFFVADCAAPEAGKPRGPIAQLAATEEHAVPGEVMMSAEAAQLAQGEEGVQLERLPDGAGAARVLAAAKALDLAAAPAANKQMDAECERLAVLSPRERVDAYQILRSHVPFNVRFRAEAGHIDSVNEVRVCTIVFFGFPSLAASGGGLDAVQAVTQTAQGRMHQDGGFFLQLRCDEKGYLALCAFGLPGRAHEDSPSRGMHAALAVVDALQRQGQAAVAGVTTGNLFCGVVGSQRRAEYTVFGDAINLAARLMVNAAREGTEGGVLCDESTRWMAAGRAEYHALRPMAVKGRAGLLRAFRATPLEAWATPGLPETSPVMPRLLAVQREHEQLQEADARAQLAEELQQSTQEEQEGGGSDEAMDVVESPPTPVAADGEADGSSAPPLLPLVGRDGEMVMAGARLAALVDGRGGGALFIEGDAGIGKTRLVEEIAWGQGLAPLRQRCAVVVGVGRAMRQSEPLYPWRKVFRQAFIIDEERSAANRARAGLLRPPNGAAFPPSELALRLRGRVPEYAQWRSVLASALGLRENELPVPAMARPGSSGSSTHSGRSRAGEGAIPRSHTVNFVDTSRRSASSSSTGLDSDSFLLPSPAAIQRAMSARNLDPGRPSSPASPTPSLTERRQQVALPPAEMSVALRATKVRGLLVALLREFVACHAPLLIVLDDVHLFDTPSWRLALAVLEELPKEALLVCTLRPFAQLQPVAEPGGGAADTALLTSPERHSPGITQVPRRSMWTILSGYYEDALRHDKKSVERLALRPFSLDETRQFVSEALGGAAMPPAAAALFWEKSAGLPAYLHQMALFLKLRAQQAEGAPAAGRAMELVRMGMEFVRATVNVHSIVPARMDRLLPDEQLTLKVASVMGVIVYADLLREAHPRSPSSRRIDAHLDALRAAGFLSPVLSSSSGGKEASPGVYCFADVLARDIVYDMIPVTRRREWHALLAEAMVWRCSTRQNKQQQVGGGSGARCIPAAIVAYHFTQASHQQETAEWRWTLKAITWWERAAAAAFSSWAFNEQVGLLQYAVTLADALVAGNQSPEASKAITIALPRWRRARWERCSAGALLVAELGEDALRQALVCALCALDTLGVPMPWSERHVVALRGLKAGVVRALVTAVSLGRRGSRSCHFEEDAAALARIEPAKRLVAVVSGAGEDLELEGGSSDKIIFAEENDGGTAEAAQEVTAALRTLVAVLLAPGAPRAGAADLRYAEWACDLVAGKQIKKKSHALHDARQRLTSALRSVKKSGAGDGVLASLESRVKGRLVSGKRP